MSNYSEDRRGGFGEDNAVVSNLGDWMVHRTEKGECVLSGVAGVGRVEVMAEIGDPCYYPGRSAFDLIEFPDFHL